mmetsp:Transcript_15455/g.34579  ORF Transcript_15455/g.34579 Transcript_15455/m.34579 type:complete len:379 (-) Transcript_15455:1124-2260(-)
MLLERAPQLLLGSLDGHLRLPLYHHVELPLARRRVAPRRVVGPLGGDHDLGPFLDGLERVALHHLVTRRLRVLVDLKLRRKALRQQRLHRRQPRIRLLLRLLLRPRRCGRHRTLHRLRQRCLSWVHRRGRGRRSRPLPRRGCFSIGEELLLHLRPRGRRPLGVAELHLQRLRGLGGSGRYRRHRINWPRHAALLRHAVVVILLLLHVPRLHPRRPHRALPPLVLRFVLLGDRVRVQRDARARQEARGSEVLRVQLPRASFRRVRVGHADDVIRRLLTGSLHSFHQVGSVLLLIGSDECVGCARVARAPCPTDTVYVVLIVVWHLVVDYEAEVFHVQAASGDRGGHEERNVARLEVGDCGIAVILPHAPMQSGAGHAVL